jgi:hypothetical protein
MNRTPGTAAADNGGAFGPEQAAALLDQTTQRARRKLEPAPPWLLATRGVLVLAALGAIWLSVRGQHPYRGPPASDIPVLIGFIVVNFAATVAVRAHAIAGVSGRTRFSRGEIAALVAAYAAAVVAMTALGAAGVSLAWYPTSVLVIPGLVWAVLSAKRGDRREVATGLALIVMGVVGAFAGPAGSWAVAAVGLCAVMLGNAAAVAWQQRA